MEAILTGSLRGPRRATFGLLAGILFTGSTVACIGPNPNYMDTEGTTDGTTGGSQVTSEGTSGGGTTEPVTGSTTPIDTDVDTGTTDGPGTSDGSTSEVTTGPFTSTGPGTGTDSESDTDTGPPPDGGVRRLIEIHNTQGIGFEDFPVLLKVPPEIIDHDSLLPDAANLYFEPFDAPGEVMDHDVEVLSADDATMIWLNLPSFPPGITKVWMYYGGEEALAPDPSWAWPWYGEVFHYEDMLFESATPGALQPLGNIGVVNQEGVVGRGAHFVGTEMLFYAGGDLSGTSKGYLSLWINPTEAPLPSNSMELVHIIGTDNQTLEARHLSLRVANADGGVFVECEIDGPSNGPVHLVRSVNEVMIGAWQHVALRWSAAEPNEHFKIYLDSQKGWTPMPAPPADFDFDESILIGAEPGVINGFVGSMDELRFSTYQLGEPWVNTSQKSVNSPDEFVMEYGDPEPAP